MKTSRMPCLEKCIIRTLITVLYWLSYFSAYPFQWNLSSSIDNSNHVDLILDYKQVSSDLYPRSVRYFMWHQRLPTLIVLQTEHLICQYNLVSLSLLVANRMPGGPASILKWLLCNFFIMSALKLVGTTTLTFKNQSILHRKFITTMKIRSYL